MKRHLSSIRASALLKPLSEKDLREHLERQEFQVRSYAKQEVVHFEGDPCRKLEIILSGQVAIDRIEESGRHLTVSDFHSDNILGAHLLFSEHPAYPMTVIAQSEALILEIDADALFRLLSTNPPFLRNYLEFIAHNSFILSSRLKQSVKRTLRERLLSYLSEEAARQGSRRVVLPTSKKRLAEKLGVQRTSLSRELAKMAAADLITYDRDAITLTVRADRGSMAGPVITERDDTSPAP